MSVDSDGGEKGNIGCTTLPTKSDKDLNFGRKLKLEPVEGRFQNPSFPATSTIAKSHLNFTGSDSEHGSCLFHELPYNYRPHNSVYPCQYQYCVPLPLYSGNLSGTGTSPRGSREIDFSQFRTREKVCGNPFGGPGLWSQKQMSMSRGSGMNQSYFLSWRDLHLSRAKLKASSRTSALLAGFAMVAMVEIQISDDVPDSLLIPFAVCTTLLVAIHMLALMISTCILPHVEAISNMHSIQAVEESPHDKMHWYIETAWAFSTVLGLMLFLVEIALLSWVKFWNMSQNSAWAATVVLIPIVIVFILFALHFYQKLVAHKYELTESGIRELERLKGQLDENNHLGNTGTGDNGRLTTGEVV